MEFVKDFGRKRSNIKIEDTVSQEEYNGLLFEKQEVSSRYEAIILKYNELVEKYNSIADELLSTQDNRNNLEKELKKQKDENLKAEQKLIEIQSHVDKLFGTYESIEKENQRQQEVIESLEKYIELMDKTQKPSIKNERGAGRKKKYSQEHINKILQLKSVEEDYSFIVDVMNREYPDRKWDIKEIKYVYTRYK